MSERIRKLSVPRNLDKAPDGRGIQDHLLTGHGPEAPQPPAHSAFPVVVLLGASLASSLHLRPDKSSSSRTDCLTSGAQGRPLQGGLGRASGRQNVWLARLGRALVANFSLKDGLLMLISCVIVVLWFYGRTLLLLGAY